MKVLKIIILSGCLFIPLLSKSQILTLDRVYPIYQNYFSGLQNEGIDYVGFLNDGNPKGIKLLRLDSSLNILSIKSVVDTTFLNGDIYLIESIKLREESSYLVFGSKASGSEFILKLDSSGHVFWQKKFVYPFFSDTNKDNLVLFDRSIFMFGNRLGNNGYDLILRRIDSLGNLIFESQNNNFTNFHPQKALRLFDGSILTSSFVGSDSIGLIKFDFNGNVIKHEIIFTGLQGSQRSQSLTLLQGNKILVQQVNLFPRNSIKYIIDLELNNINLQSSPIIENPNFRVNGDSTIYSFGYSNSNQIKLFEITPFLNYNDSFSIDSTNSTTDIFGILNESNSESLLYGGKYYTDTSISGTWIGRMSGMKPFWSPDPCVISPPISGFEFDYSYPILTLLDTSYSGIKYLDTIYTWLWNTSVGQSGTDDSLMIFFDTAVSKTLDVQLIISNWYECLDTLDITLNFTPNGIEEFKEFKVQLWPNPVDERLNISFDESFDQVSFKLYDLQGKQKLQTILNQSSSQVSLSNLASGLYFCEVRTGERVWRGKVVKN